MDSKGQAFSTFKLLIAAVVAMVILGILLGIVGIIPNLGVGDPQEEAETLLKKMYTSQGRAMKSSVVTFEKDMSIGARDLALSSRSGLIEEQICLSAGAYGESTRFNEHEEGKVITYTGSAPMAAKLGGVCDSRKLLSDTIKTYASGILDIDWYDSLGCCPSQTGSGEDDTTICCFIAVVPSEEA